MKTSLRHEEVQHILKHGKRYVHNGFLVCVLGDGSGRFAVLVSKKVARSAVVRNRMRRVLREVVRTVDSVPFDFVVLQNKGNLSSEFIQTSLPMVLNTIIKTR